MEFVFFFILLFVLLYVIIHNDFGRYHKIILFGLCLRLCLLFITCMDIVSIPDAHGDADVFHDIALANQNSYGGKKTNYTDFLTIIYSLSDSSRWFAQYVNLVFGILFLIYLRKIVISLNVDRKLAKRLLIVASLMPFLNIYSVVLLREAWICFFTIFSLYHFVCWYLNKGNSGLHIFFTFIGILLSMLMHAGSLGIMIGYILAFVTYYRKGNRIKLSKSSFVAFFFVSIFAVIFILNIEIFAAKLITEDMEETIEKRGAGAGGDSDYLTWIDLSSPKNMIMFSPLKMFYFLYSPIMTDWRGLNDIAAFFMDSIVYLFASFFILFRKESNPHYKLLKRYLAISFLATTFMFSFGTSNAGTAIRHRAKICSILFVMCGISDSQSRKRRRLMTIPRVITSK